MASSIPPFTESFFFLTPIPKKISFMEKQNVSHNGFCESKAELGSEDFGSNRYKRKKFVDIRGELVRSYRKKKTKSPSLFHI